MKRRRLTYDEWKCILDKKQKIKYIDNENYSGYVSKIDILNVSAPQIWRFNGEDIVVCRMGIAGYPFCQKRITIVSQLC